VKPQENSEKAAERKRLRKWRQYGGTRYAPPHGHWPEWVYAPDGRFEHASDPGSGGAIPKNHGESVDHGAAGTRAETEKRTKEHNVSREDAQALAIGTTPEDLLAEFDAAEMEEWADGAPTPTRCREGCYVEPDGCCSHGYASLLIEAGLI
jgi:hypothetical protein